MTRKWLLGIIFAVVMLLLILGGINRTRDRLAQVNENDKPKSNPVAGNVAPPEKWETAVATVTAMRSNGLWLELANGTEARARRAAWGYAQEQGFSAEVGDRISLTGYKTTGGFEIVTMLNEENGKVVALRDADGRSLWGGHGGE